MHYHKCVGLMTWKSRGHSSSRATGTELLKLIKTGAVWEKSRRVCFLCTKTRKLVLDGCQRDKSCEMFETPICTCFSRLEPVCEKSHTRSYDTRIMASFYCYIRGLEI